MLKRYQNIKGQWQTFFLIELMTSPDYNFFIFNAEGIFCQKLSMQGITDRQIACDFPRWSPVALVFCLI